jgi:hypothetical protein
MRVSVLAFSVALLLASCSKSDPAPPTLVGVWHLVSIRYVTETRNSTTPDDYTYTATANSGALPQEFTADGRVLYRRLSGSGSFRPYRFDGKTIVVSLGTGDIQWSVHELSAHRLIYQEVEDDYVGRFTQTFTYSR